MRELLFKVRFVLNPDRQFLQFANLFLVRSHLVFNDVLHPVQPQRIE